MSVCPRMCRYQKSKANGYYSGFFALNYDWDNQFMGASVLLELMQPLLLRANGGTAPASLTDGIDYMTRTMAAWQNRENNNCPTDKGWPGNWRVGCVGCWHSHTNTRAYTHKHRPHVPYLCSGTHTYTHTRMMIRYFDALPPLLPSHPLCVCVCVCVCAALLHSWGLPLPDNVST